MYGDQLTQCQASRGHNSAAAQPFTPQTCSAPQFTKNKHCFKKITLSVQERNQDIETDYTKRHMSPEGIA